MSSQQSSIISSSLLNKDPKDIKIVHLPQKNNKLLDKNDSKNMEMVELELDYDDLNSLEKHKYNKLIKQVKLNHNKTKSKLKKVNTNVRYQVPKELESLLSKPFPVDINFQAPRFDVNDKQAYEYLKQNGYVIIKEVLTQEECLKLRNETWDWLEKLNFPNEVKIKRNDPETWHDGNWPSDPRTGIVFSFGAGQTKMSWYIRDKEKVKQSFGNIFNTEDLITSFDGFNLYRPWKYFPKWRTMGKWWHIDQNSRRKESSGFQCCQGLVPLLDCNPEYGGLAVIPKSHFKHDEICNRVRWPGGDFVPIPKKDKIFDEFKNGIMVNCKAGDLCLWDSRTVHCNIPSNLPNVNPKTGKSWKLNKSKSDWDLIRMTYYICMTPRYKAKNDILKKRQNAFKLHNTSTHWPHYYAHRIGSGYVPHGLFKLNKSQLNLVGYPRGYISEFIWKCKYKWELNTNDLVASVWTITFASITAKIIKNWWFNK